MAELKISTDEIFERTGCTRAAVDVINERHRQVRVEGWTPEHDDTQRKHGELSMAAASFAYNAFSIVAGTPNANQAPVIWPWRICDWKPKGARLDLVRAGALILAEIERLDRKDRMEGLDL